MSDYKNGKIYQLRIGDMFYIGSTTYPLSARFGWHKKDYTLWCKNCTQYKIAYELFKMGLPVIELIELYPCDSRQELERREGWYQLANPDCVNKNIAGRTYIEYREANRTQFREQQKAYYQANRAQILEQQKAYCIANRAQMIENKKAHYQANRTQILENKKAYRIANRAQIREQRKAYYADNKIRIAKQRKIYRESGIRTKRLTAFIEKHILSIKKVVI